MLATVSPAFAQDPNPLPPANGEYIYGQRYFDAAYAAGYIRLRGGVCHGTVSSDGTTCTGTNTSKNANIYVDFYDGAIYKTTKYDVRIYPWMTPASGMETGNESWIIYLSDGHQNGNGTGTGVASYDFTVTTEFHFYESGTLATNRPVEVSWQGVMSFVDMDIYEGIQFSSGLYGDNVWLNNLTTVIKQSSPVRTWRGSWGGVTSREELEELGYSANVQTLWAEVSGTPSSPLTLVHWRGSYSSGFNYRGNSITYRVLGTVPSGGTLNNTVEYCATYGNYNVLQPASVPGRNFSGWYTDATMTQPASSTLQITSNRTLYGAYTQAVTTKVTNGTITASDTNIAYGGNKTITYSPKAGYKLKSVTVDGTAVNITTYPSSYTFSNVRVDHNIEVVYEVDTKDITVSKFWDDFNNKYNLRPDSLIFDAFIGSGTTSVGNCTANASNSWKCTISGLAKINSSGEAITYIVKERNVPSGYIQTTGSISTADGTTATVSNKLQTVDIEINKIWEDDGDRDGVRPSTISVILLQNEIEFDTAAITGSSSNTWTYTFRNLPKYDTNGELFSYNVEEAVSP